MQESFFDSSSQSISQLVGPEISVSLPSNLSLDSYRFRKISEQFVATIALILLTPFFILCALAITLTSRGSVLYRQERVGKDGATFNIIKFRTMVHNAEAASGPVLSVASDSRVTRLGRFFRNTHIDELPQLLNIAAGSMSFIGPRPERPVFVQQYRKSVPFYSHREKVLPGVTGLAQICLPYDATAEEKIKYDLQYVRNIGSLKLQAAILWFTLLKSIKVRFNA